MRWIESLVGRRWLVWSVLALAIVVLVVSSLHPQGPRKTLNMVEFYYPEEIVAFEREFVDSQQAAYMETCVEDDEIALRMDAGRQALGHGGLRHAQGARCGAHAAALGQRHKIPDLVQLH